jgi:hypothetical protein
MVNEEMERIWKKAIAVKIETLKFTCKFVLEPRRGLTWLDSVIDKILIDPIRTLFCKVTAERNVKNPPTLINILHSLNASKLMRMFRKINKTFRGL